MKIVLMILVIVVSMPAHAQNYNRYDYNSGGNYDRYTNSPVYGGDRYTQEDERRDRYERQIQQRPDRIDNGYGTLYNNDKFRLGY
ncbi:MAG: hypothetical protein MI745_14115 [Pseudomonadales bacterium]|nr:hypothetical protein [Pseudomonadales bacterium]